MIQLDQLIPQVHAVLRHVEQADRAGRREAIDGPTFLEAARGCWLLGRTNWAQRFYKLAWANLLEDARTYGVRGSNYGAYALLALGAAWASGERLALVGVSREVEAHTHRLLAHTADSVLRAGLELTLMRATWLRGSREAAESLQRLEGHVSRMQPGTLAQWEAARGYFVVPIYRSLMYQQPARAADALMRFEKHLLEGVEPPFTVADLVDEEFVVLATAVAAADVDLSGLILPYQPGAAVSAQMAGR